MTNILLYRVRKLCDYCSRITELSFSHILLNILYEFKSFLLPSLFKIASQILLLNHMNKSEFSPNDITRERIVFYVQNEFEANLNHM